MRNLEKFGVQNLNAQEIRKVDGGCPMAWYIDDDTIAQNGREMAIVGPVYGKIARFLCESRLGSKLF